MGRQPLPELQTNWHIRVLINNDFAILIDATGMKLR